MDTNHNSNNTTPGYVFNVEIVDIGGKEYYKKTLIRKTDNCVIDEYFTEKSD